MRRLLEELSLRPSPPWFDQWVDDGVGRRVGQQLIVELLDWASATGGTKRCSSTSLQLHREIIRRASSGP